MIEHLFCFVNGRALVWCLFHAPESDRIDPEDRRNNSARPGVSDAGQTDCAPGGSRPLLAADDLRLVRRPGPAARGIRAQGPRGPVAIVRRGLAHCSGVRIERPGRASRPGPGGSASGQNWRISARVVFGRDRDRFGPRFEARAPDSCTWKRPGSPIRPQTVSTSHPALHPLIFVRNVALERRGGSILPVYQRPWW
jgi:hypothetical protein